MKGKVCKMVVRPAMMSGLEMVTLTKRQETGPEVAGLKISIGIDQDGLH